MQKKLLARWSQLALATSDWPKSGRKCLSQKDPKDLMAEKHTKKLFIAFTGFGRVY